MSVGNIIEKANLRYLLKALAAWFVAAIVLLLLAAIIVSSASVSLSAMGYISSALSFLTAAVAGMAAGRAGSGAKFYLGLITSAVIVTMLLTIGFLVRGSEMASSGILSVVSFSFTGCLFGAVFLSGKKNNKKRSKYLPGQRRK